MMKRLFKNIPLIPAVFCIMFALAGCGGTSSPASNNNNIVNGGNGNNGDTTTPTFTVTFDSAGGTPVVVQNVEENDLAIAPTPPTKAWLAPAGLWRSLVWDSLPETHNFDGWWNGDEKWGFDTDEVTENITLTARWTAPAYTPIATVAANDVQAAVTHVNSNAASGPFTLAIDQPYVESGQNTLNATNVHLTIVGISEQREIRFINTANNQRLFNLTPPAGSYASLILGNNITLVGRSADQHGQANNTVSLVQVGNRGRLYMEDGSKITGHTSNTNNDNAGQGSAVQINNGGAFTMRGGEITGNHAPMFATFLMAGGLLLRDGSAFTIEGGARIHGNTRGDGTSFNLVRPADVVAVNDSLRDSLRLDERAGYVNGQRAVNP